MVQGAEMTVTAAFMGMIPIMWAVGQRRGHKLKKTFPGSRIFSHRQTL
jgi:hypothetical protein